MQKKVTLLCGSPRPGGNSSRLAQAFALGAERAGHTTQTFDLAMLNIAPCRACRVCNSRQGQCVQQDDMARISEALVQSDVIVLATPTWFYSVSGQLKTALDRTVARYTQMQNKEVYFLVSAWDPDPANLEPVLATLRGWVSCLPGGREAGRILATGCENAGDVERTSFVAQALSMGQSC